MTTKFLCFAVGVAILATICLHAPKICAQSLNGNGAAIEMETDGGSGERKRSRTLEGVMEPVGLAAGKGIAITLEVSREKAGAPVIVSPLDGGQVNATLITPEGTVALSAYGTDIQDNLFISEDGELRRESLFVADDGTVLKQGLFVTDAGTVRKDRLIVSEDGKAGFSFQAGLTPGLYRVLVGVGGDQYILQLYAVAPAP